MLISDVTGVLLAGGKSRRMGEDKRFLSIGGQTLLDHGVSVLQTLFQDVCIVIAQDSPLLSTTAPVVRDLVPDCGSLGGLYTGLREVRTTHIFVAACDMPFLNLNVIRFMVGLKEAADIVVASWNSRLQPTHAIYGKRCLPVLEDMIHRREMAIQGLCEHRSLRVRLVTENELSAIDAEGLSFVNINDPSDLAAARLRYDDASAS